MTDPTTPSPPDAPTIRLALATARAGCLSEREVSYWHGVVDALSWALGDRFLAPVSAVHVRVKLDSPVRLPALYEAKCARRCIEGRRLTAASVRYLQGVEQVCKWLVTGTGFPGAAQPDRSAFSSPSQGASPDEPGTPGDPVT